MKDNCGITFEQMFDYFQGYFTEDLKFYTLLQYMTWISGVNPTGTPLVYLMTVIQLYTVYIGEQYLGIGSTNYYGISAQLGEPDNDWSLLCDDCVWSHTFDFTVDDGGFSAFGVVLPANPTGVWASGVGWTFTDALWSNAPVQYRRAVAIRRDIVPDTELTSFSLTYDLTKGAYSASVTALGMGMQLDATTPASASETSAVITNGVDKVKLITSTQTADRIYVLITPSAQPSAVYSGDVVIKSITLTGTGDNPFI